MRGALSFSVSLPLADWRIRFTVKIQIMKKKAEIINPATPIRTESGSIRSNHLDPELHDRMMFLHV